MTTQTTATPIGPYLQDGERLCHLLTNTQMGVEHGADGARAVRPSDEGAAYLGLTNRRIVVLVVDPVERDADFVTSHRYTNVVDVTVRPETLTARVEFETEYGREYSFTTRESDVETVAAFLSNACDEPSVASVELESHCEALAAHLADGEWEAFDNRLEATVEWLDRDPVGGGATAREFHCLVRDRYVLAGREKLTSARRRLDAGDLKRAYRRARTAYDSFEEALERARQEDLASKNAMVGLTMADDIADTSLGRLFATGRHRFSDAADRDERGGRIADLEAALDTYETVAALVTGDETLSDRPIERAREEAAAAIEGLVDARLERAREDRETAAWERGVGNEGVAQELAESARADLDRALELATAYPAGDVDTIRERRAELVGEFGLDE